MIRRAVILLAALLGTAPALRAEPIRYPVGENLTYRILWGILPVGQADIRCEEVEEQGRRLIRIRVEAKSNRLVSALYPVDDRVECYVDPATGLPLRVEKRTSEGGYVCDDTLTFDRAAGTARWESRSASIATNYAIRNRTLDAATLLYALRSTAFLPHQPETLHVAVDGLLHGLTVTAHESRWLEAGDGGPERRCTRFAVVPERADLFVRKIPGEIWVMDDAPRIMVRMKAKLPVGHVQIVFDRHIPAL